MLDINFILENTELVKENILNKNVECNLDEVISAYKEYKNIVQKSTWRFPPLPFIRTRLTATLSSASKTQIILKMLSLCPAGWASIWSPPLSAVCRTKPLSKIWTNLQRSGPILSLLPSKTASGLPSKTARCFSAPINGRAARIWPQRQPYGAKCSK